MRHNAQFAYRSQSLISCSAKKEQIPRDICIFHNYEMEPKFQPPKKSKCILVSELLDIAVPPAEKNAALRTLFKTIVEELGIQNAETNVVRMLSQAENPPKSELNVQEIIADISKTLDQAIRHWIKCNRYAYGSMMELAEFLRNQGFPSYAEYLENCVDNSAKIDDCGDEISPLVGTKEESCPYKNTFSQNPTLTDEHEKSPNRLREKGKWPTYFNPVTKNPIISGAFFSIGLFIGILTGIGLTLLFSTKQSTAPHREHLNLAHDTETTLLAMLSTGYVLADSAPKTSTELAIVDPNSCDPLGAAKNQNSTNFNRIKLSKIVPDWSQEILNFCEMEQAILIVDTEHLATLFQPGDPLPEIHCPERIMELHFVHRTHWRFVQVLVAKLCRVEKLSFFGRGEEGCSSDSGVDLLQTVKIPLNSISALHIEGFSRCRDLYEDISRFAVNLRLEKVSKISFKCVDFDTRDPTQLQGFINSFPRLESVRCLNQDNCVTFNAKVGRGVTFMSGYDPCFRSGFI